MGLVDIWMQGVCLGKDPKDLVAFAESTLNHVEYITRAHGVGLDPAIESLGYCSRSWFTKVWAKMATRLANSRDFVQYFKSLSLKFFESEDVFSSSS